MSSVVFLPLLAFPPCPNVQRFLTLGFVDCSTPGGLPLLGSKSAVLLVRHMLPLPSPQRLPGGSGV